jgi:predicted GTPase
MAHGAGFLAAVEAGAAEIVDPRSSAVGHIAAAFAQYPHIGKVLPALGYSADQLADLAATVNRSDADVVVIGSPSDLARLVAINKPVARARYEFAEVDAPHLAQRLDEFLQATGRR